jgi:hypothetical protein
MALRQKNSRRNQHSFCEFDCRKLRFGNSNRIGLTDVNFCSKIDLERNYFGEHIVPLHPSTVALSESNYSSDMHKLHCGGITGALRGICVISAAIRQFPADTKCQFSGLTGTSRPPFQRKYCNMCDNCDNNSNICVIW